MWFLLLPVRLALAISLYTIGIFFLLTIVGIPVGLACFALARGLLAPR